MHPIWLVALLVLAVPIAGRAWWQRRRNKHDLLQLARRKGLTFAPLDLIGLHERYNNLELIRRGHNRYVWNIIYGTTQAGLVAVFRYSYDRGFGVHQSTRQFWMAVIESPGPLPAWRAQPAAEVPFTGEERSVRVGPLVVTADRLETLEFLREPAVSGVLASVPETCQLESHYNLLAIAVPFDVNIATPERLLSVLTELAVVLRDV